MHTQLTSIQYTQLQYSAILWTEIAIVLYHLYNVHIIHKYIYIGYDVSNFLSEVVTYLTIIDLII